MNHATRYIAAVENGRRQRFLSGLAHSFLEMFPSEFYNSTTSAGAKKHMRRVLAKVRHHQLPASSTDSKWLIGAGKATTLVCVEVDTRNSKSVAVELEAISSKASNSRF